MGNIKRYIPVKINEILSSKKHIYIRWNKDLSSDMYELDYEGLVITCDTILRIAGTRGLDENNYVEIQRDSFFKILHNNYKLYLDYLIEENIVQTDNQYIVGEKSIGYKLNEDLMGNGLDSIEINNNLFNKRTINAIKMADFSLNISKKHKDNYIKSFKIDFQKACEYLSFNYLNGIKDHKDRLLTRYTSDLLYSKLNYINDGQLWITRSKTNGRITSNLTSLNGDYKQFILGYDNILDVVSSQPTLLLVLINLIKFINGNGELLFSSYSLLSSYVQKISEKSINTNGFPKIIDLLKKVKLPSENELNLWVKLCRDGNLYEYFQTELYEKTGVKYKRQQIKEIVFNIMYSNPRLDNENKKLFNAIFPSIYKFMGDIKNLYKIKRSHKLLPILLQVIESYVWIETILVDLDTMNIKYLFIHDAVIIKKEDVDRVNLKILEKYFLLGLNVNVKTEKLKK